MTRSQAIGIFRKRYVEACANHDKRTAHRMMLCLEKLRDKRMSFDRSSDYDWKQR